METQLTPRRRLVRCGIAPLLLMSTAVVATPALAGGTRAGTVINNTATATWGTGDGSTTISSNTVSVKVDEVLDVTVASRDSGDAVVTASGTGVIRSFVVTNAGNGDEAFTLDASVAPNGGFAPVITGLAIDRDGNGLYDAAIDTLLANGGSSDVIAPDGTFTVLVLSNIPADVTDTQRADIRLTATAATGSGTPGTVFGGKGVDGGDAVVGATTASARDQGGLIVSRATVAFVKSATIVDSFGTARPIPGARITYRLVATVSGSGAASGLKIADAIPDGTAYQAGTLQLDGTALSDPADGDAGSAGASGIAVTLGDVVAGREHTITFTVRIK